MDENRNALLEFARSREARRRELDELLAAPEILGDGVLWRKYAREREACEKTARVYRKWRDTRELYEACIDDAKGLEGEEKRVAEAEIAAVGAELDASYAEILLASLPSGGAESATVIEIRAQGAQSGIFAEELVSTYSAFAKLLGFGFALNSAERYESGGYREARLTIKGEGSAEYLGSESGVHRAEYAGGVSRTVSVAAYPAPDERTYEPSEDEIRVELFHSGGAGGQNVNKVETAVRARHLPTGIIAVCQDERTQRANRERAVKELTERVRAYYRGLEEELYLEGKERAYSAKGRIRVYDLTKNELRDVRLGAPVAFRMGSGESLKEALALLRINALE